MLDSVAATAAANESAVATSTFQVLPRSLKPALVDAVSWNAGEPAPRAMLSPVPAALLYVHEATARTMLQPAGAPGHAVTVHVPDGLVIRTDPIVGAVPAPESEGVELFTVNV